jgi:hypothetical protein
MSAVHIVHSSRQDTHRKADQAEVTCFHQYMLLLSRIWRLTNWLAHDCELCVGGVEGYAISKKLQRLARN